MKVYFRKLIVCKTCHQNYPKTFTLGPLTSIILLLHKLCLPYSQLWNLPLWEVFLPKCELEPNYLNEQSQQSSHLGHKWRQKSLSQYMTENRELQKTRISSGLKIRPFCKFDWQPPGCQRMKSYKNNETVN